MKKKTIVITFVLGMLSSIYCGGLCAQNDGFFSEVGGSRAYEEAGDYYIWGEVNKKTLLAKYFYCTAPSDISGDYNYDFVRRLWGNNWRMTKEGDVQEIEDNYDWFWTDEYERYGYRLVSELNSNRLLLHPIGLKVGESIAYQDGDIVGVQLQKKMLRMKFIILHLTAKSFLSMHILKQDAFI